MRRSFTSACKKAGIDYGRDVPNGIVFHDLRASVKTNMLQAGIDKVFRDVFLGHTLTGMDSHYLRPTEDNLKKAMEAYTWWLDNQIKNASVDHTVDQNQ